MPLTARTGMCVNTALLIKCVSYTNTILVCLVLSTTSSFNFLTISDGFKSFVGCVCDSASKLTASSSRNFSEHCSQLFVSMAIPIKQNSGGGKFLSFTFCDSGPSSFHVFKTVLLIPCALYVLPATWVELVFYNEVTTWLSLA